MSKARQQGLARNQKQKDVEAPSSVVNQNINFEKHDTTKMPETKLCSFYEYYSKQ